MPTPPEVPRRARRTGGATTLPAGCGELGDLVRTYDWARTPLGPIAAWPQSLIFAVSTLLLSPVPIVLLWGPDGIMIYNDAYSGFAGGRHPQLLGSKVREGWPEVADFNDHVMRVGLAGGTLSYRHQELTLYRYGRPEPVWMNLDYSPVFGEDGQPAGVIAIVVESTERVLAERRLRESEALFRTLAQGIPHLIWRAAIDGACIWASPQWSAYTGLDDGASSISASESAPLPLLCPLSTLTAADDLALVTLGSSCSTSMSCCDSAFEAASVALRFVSRPGGDGVCSPLL